jgi:hypothetical protein
MSDLPFDFSETLDAFECPEPIHVYERTGSYVDGYWVEEKGEPRELRCILLNADERKLEIETHGRHVAEAYSIMYPGYKEPLHVMYHQGKAVHGKQTYAIIDDKEFVVVNFPETRKNAAFHSYYAIRFEEQENPAEVDNE